MKSTIKKWLPALLLCAAQPALAAETTSAVALPNLGYEGNVTPLPPQDGAAAPKQWDRALPFFAQRVVDRGIDLPNPYDVGFSYYYTEQNMLLSNLKVSVNDNPLRSAGFVAFPKSTLENHSEQVQVGAWLFPFMNVYGIAGHISGGGDIGLSIKADDAVQFITGIDRCSGRRKPDWCGKTLEATARANYDGYSYGVGMTLVGNLDRLFFSLPVTYTVSNVSMSDTDAKSLNVAPRVGVNWQLGDYGTVMTYAGATYLHTTVTITGSATLPTSETDIGEDTKVNFSIDEKIANPWNGLAGFHWMVNRNISLMAELAFGARQGYILSAFYRF
ncbi:hypothetical protein [Jeongeupia naejangsanensis]|uniref:Uncharacterized protein n=1 Tax=Jeongeupia naejangsanensis TaxID=613195 RepID=A0ABS2BFL6_9NEIS|nr:hypothetical protein [Jeongeupia naejangsanensis]MBM3114390.1 hypothetical protein [Jeongeupia naejangsanensis]